MVFGNLSGFQIKLWTGRNI